MTIEQDFPVVAPTSRMQYYHLPVVNPGKCACCGSVERPVVDFGMTIEFYGAVLLCVTCLAEAGQIVGLVPVEQLREAQESLAQSTEETLRQERKVTITYEQRDSLTLAIRGLSDLILSLSPSDDSVDASPTGEAEPTILDAIDGTESIFSEELLGDLGSAEQSSNTSVSEGPDELSDDNKHGDTPFGG